MTIIFYFGMRLELTCTVSGFICTVSCGGQSTTFAAMLTDVFIHNFCIGSDVNIYFALSPLKLLYSMTRISSMSANEPLYSCRSAINGLPRHKEYYDMGDHQS